MSSTLECMKLRGASSFRGLNRVAKIDQGMRGSNSGGDTRSVAGQVDKERENVSLMPTALADEARKRQAKWKWQTDAEVNREDPAVKPFKIDGFST